MKKIDLFDSHLHLQDFDNDLAVPDILKTAKDEGVSLFLCNGTSSDDWSQVESYSLKDQSVIPSYGLHPWFVGKEKDGWQEKLEEIIKGSNALVGEIGLDRNDETFDQDAIEDAFIYQLRLAAKYNRPVTIHCVKHWGRLLEILKSETSLPPAILFHAYGGSSEMVKSLYDYGAYFSFSGSVLFENHKTAREAIKEVHLDRLLIETDAPNMLPPEEYRRFTFEHASGKTYNHPANLPIIAKGVAGLLNQDLGRLKSQLWCNSKAFLSAGNV